MKKTYFLIIKLNQMLGKLQIQTITIQNPVLICNFNIFSNFLNISCKRSSLNVICIFKREIYVTIPYYEIMEMSLHCCGPHRIERDARPLNSKRRRSQVIYNFNLWLLMCERKIYDVLHQSRYLFYQ